MILWLTLAVVAGMLLAAGLSAVYLADSFTRSRRTRVQGTPADLGLRYEEIQFLTADRLTLRGWFMDSPGARATVVLVHDLGATRAERARSLLYLQRDYVRRGFSVFAFDLRGGEYGIGMTMPDTITLYRLPLLEEADALGGGEEGLRRAVRETIWHEVAHYFGFDERAVNAREEDGTNRSQ